MALLPEYGLDVKIVLINNGTLGMVKQWQISSLINASHTQYLMVNLIFNENGRSIWRQRFLNR